MDESPRSNPQEKELTVVFYRCAFHSARQMLMATSSQHSSLGVDQPEDPVHIRYGCRAVHGHLLRSFHIAFPTGSSHN
jgi:hypothetical protein